MTSNWDKFSLLMWKNWRLQWNHKIQLFVELFLPVIFVTLLIIIRSLVSPEAHPYSSTFEPTEIKFDLNGTLPFYQQNPSTKTIQVAYYPKSECLENIMPFVENWLNNNNNLNDSANFIVLGYNSIDELDREVKSKRAFAAVQFDDSFVNAIDIPQKISYSIRFPSELKGKNVFETLQNWQTNNLFPKMDFGGLRVPNDVLVDSQPSYYMEGFIGIQHAFALAFIETLKSPGVVVPDVLIQRFPYPPYIFDPVLKGLESFVSLIFLISFVYPCSQIVKYVTTEKENQLKEVMKIMGLPSWLHWTAWFSKAFPLILASISFMVILIKVHWSDSNVAVLTNCEWSILLFFLIVYSISMITFCFMVATFFSKANTAAAVSGLVWFIMYLPYQLTEANYSSLSFSSKMGLSLFSNSAMAFGFKLILKLEGTGQGLQWNNIFSPVNSDDNISIGYFVIMLLVDSILYMAIALYVEKIFPGSYGVSEKWYFLFTKKFWFRNDDRQVKTEYPENVMRKNPSAFEIEPKNRNIGLSMKSLSKKFGDKNAVNSVTFNLYEDEITVLLGHNGAGKTTTMSMLTGMIPPTSGTAILNGHDITNNLMDARMSLGFCPQHNILFDELTVREHIEFFGRLKGLKKHEVKAEVEKYVNLLQLEDKIDTQSKKLSGGMKRKLSVAAALCGGSKVVLCDEPTSGMDASARRALWDLLEGERKGRTILLSTHFMDEADVLGDRIAIMCNGELKAYGTSFFLKKKYGAGYHLICVKKQDCKSSEITDLLRRYIPEIKIESEIGSELSYQLSDKYSSLFERMLRELEENSDAINLNGYGISNTTLEEVFMQVGSDKQDEIDMPQRDENQENGMTNENSTHHHVSYNSDLLNGFNLTISQWKAMILKKLLYIIRNYILLGIQNFMPIFFVIVTVLIYKSVDPFKVLNSLNLTIDEYVKTVTVLETSNKNVAINTFDKEYENYIKSFGSNHQFLKIQNNFTEYMLELEKKDLIKVNLRYVVGGRMIAKDIIATFNAQLLHTLPLSLNIVHNALLRSVTSKGAYSFSVRNHPLPYSYETKLTSKNATQIGIQLAINLSFCMSFVTAFFILFQIKERVSRAKLLQFVSGVRVLTFWLSQLIIDYLNYLITAIITLITIACFQPDGFSTGAELGRTFLVLILFGITSIPLTYLWAFMFTESATGFTRLSIFNIFTGMALIILTFVLKMFVEKDVLSIVNSVLLVFPHYLFGNALNNINTITTTTNNCLKLCDYNETLAQYCNMEVLCLVLPKYCCVPDYFDWKEPGIGSHLVYTFGTFAVIILILFIKEYQLIDELIFYFRKYFFQKFRKMELDGNQTHILDDDVKEENLKIAKMSANEVRSTNLILNGISKYYWKFLAVNKISAAVNKFECFGLLGVNGAGKTTTFKMLTGDERISSGEAYVKGLSIKRSMREVYREIGYCPQFDALLEDLTGREILRIFSLLRGIPEYRINLIITELANGFGFTKHLDKPVKAYSGGNKRKLSTSIALLGSPSVVYLDEPTTGMDPGAKRQLWNKVCEIRDLGKSIVLTSHSMEECEALCTRLAIMVNGEFKCIGSTQHLKNKFSKGLILSIKLNRNLSTDEKISKIKTNRLLEVNQNSEMIPHNEIERIIQFVKENFKEAEIKEQHQGLLTFYIPQTSIKWSKIFGIMEAKKNELNIEDYSISQTTLQEIFLEFAKHQKEDDTRNKKKKNNRDSKVLV